MSLRLPGGFAGRRVPMRRPVRRRSAVEPALGARRLGLSGATSSTFCHAFVGAVEILLAERAHDADVQQRLRRASDRWRATGRTARARGPAGSCSSRRCPRSVLALTSFGSIFSAASYHSAASWKRSASKYRFAELHARRRRRSGCAAAPSAFSAAARDSSSGGRRLRGRRRGRAAAPAAQPAARRRPAVACWLPMIQPTRRPKNTPATPKMTESLCSHRGQLSATGASIIATSGGTSPPACGRDRRRVPSIDGAVAGLAQHAAASRVARRPAFCRSRTDRVAYGSSSLETSSAGRPRIFLAPPPRCAGRDSRATARAARGWRPVGSPAASSTARFAPSDAPAMPTRAGCTSARVTRDTGARRARPRTIAE